MNQDDINLSMFFLVSQGRMSPETIDAQMLPSWLQTALKVMRYQLDRGAATPLNLKDTWTIAKTQYDAGEEVKIFLQTLDKHECSDEVQQVIAESSVLRRLITKASEQLQQGSYNLEYLRRLLEIKGNSEKYCYTLKEIAEAEKKQPDRMIPTRIPQLDRVIGGLKPELVLLCARPKQGKSTFFFNLIVRNPDRRIVYVSITDYDRFDVLNEISAIDNKAVSRENLWIYDYTGYAAAMNDIETAFRERQPEILIVDRSEEMAKKDAKEEERAKLKGIAISLRRLAKKYQCPVLTDGQLAESAEKAMAGGRMLTFSHMAEDKTGRAAMLDLFAGLHRHREGVDLCVNGRRKGLPQRITIPTDPVGRYLNYE